MGVEVENLGDQPDRRAVEEAAEKERQLGSEASGPPVAQVKGSAVNTQESAEKDYQLGCRWHLLPVVADEQEDGQADEEDGDGPQCEEGPPLLPGGAFVRHLVQTENVLGL